MPLCGVPGCPPLTVVHAGKVRVRIAPVGVLNQIDEAGDPVLPEDVQPWSTNCICNYRLLDDGYHLEHGDDVVVYQFIPGYGPSAWPVIATLKAVVQYTVTLTSGSTSLLRDGDIFNVNGEVYGAFCVKDHWCFLTLLKDGLARPPASLDVTLRGYGDHTREGYKLPVYFMQPLEIDTGQGLMFVSCESKGWELVV